MLATQSATFKAPLQTHPTSTSQLSYSPLAAQPFRLVFTLNKFYSIICLVCSHQAVCLAHVNTDLIAHLIGTVKKCAIGVCHLH